MKWMLILASALLTSGAIAQSGGQYTLKQAQDYAVENSYTTQNSKLDIENSRKRVSETRGIGLPQINGYANFNWFLDIPIQVAPATAFGDPNADPDELIPLQFGTDYSGNYGLSVSQLLFDGSYFVGLRAAKTFVELSTNQHEKSEIDTKNQVATIYGQVLVAMENEKVLKANKTNLEKILGDTKALYETGFAEEQDVDQAQLLLSGVDNAVRNAERQVENAKNLLRYQMGLPMGAPLELTEDLPTILGLENSSALIDTKFNAQSHIDYRIAETNERLMALDVSNKNMTFVPRLSAFYSYEENTFANSIGDWGDTFFPTNLLGVKLEVPILNGGMKFAQKSQAKIAYEQATIMKNQVEQGKLLEAQTARSNYEYALDAYNNEKKNLDLAESIRNKTLIKYQEGVSTSMDLSQAENQFLTTQGNYINSLLNLVQAKAELDMILGNY